MNPAVLTHDLTKTYVSSGFETRAIRGVDLSIAAGEFVMLSGPSGSGKTTLLSILGCVLSATSGRFELLGKDITRARESELAELRRQYIGFVFQFHNLLASLTAVENVMMLLEMRGFGRKLAKQEALRLLRSVHLEHKLDALPRELSGGQRQRVAIARALAGAPPVILADEPTATLDAPNGLIVTELLRNLAKEHGHTVVIVTHDNRIFHLADRIVHIEDGLIVGEKRPESLEPEKKVS